LSKVAEDVSDRPVIFVAGLNESLIEKLSNLLRVRTELDQLVNRSADFRFIGMV
jgi:hypothetical protein